MESGLLAEHLRITRLRVLEYRNAAPADLNFGQGFTVLLGCNGTGKTSLLDLVSMAASGDFSPVRSARFELEYTLSIGDREIDVRIGNRPQVQSTLEADFRVETERHARASRDADAKIMARWEQPTNDWHCRVSLRTQGRSEQTFDLSPGQNPTNRLRYGSPFETGIAYSALLPEHASNRSQAFSVASAARRATNCVRMDEALGLYADVVGHERASVPMGGRSLRAMLDVRQHFPAQNPDRPMLEQPPTSISFRMNFIPESFLNGLFRGLEKGAPADRFLLEATELPFLEKFVGLSDFESATAVLPLSRRSFDSEDGGMVLTQAFQGPAFQFVTRKGGRLTHDHLSFGQKRLLAFLYYADVVGSPIVADELVNGLHHSWIASCIDEIQAQAFLSSQNPLLFDFMEFSSAQDVMERFVLCATDTRGDWMWKNISKQQAEGFFRAYKTGFQHVGEILQTLELW